MYKRAVVSVPGKLILMGEHAAVYGQPALVAAVDPRARVEVAVVDRDVRIELPDFEQRLDTTWPRVVELAERSRNAWQRYADEPTLERFAEVGSDSPSDLILVALGEVAAELGSDRLPPLAVRVESSLPIGSGFGSSAATAVATIGGVLTLVGGAADPPLVDRLALEVERRQHGLPSGVDHKTVLHGGVVWAERHPELGLEVTGLATQAPILSRLQVFHTGRPAETTGEVVAAVRRRWEQEPEGVGELLARMGRDVAELRDQLLRAHGGVQQAGGVIRDYERCLEELGVVPTAIRDTILEVEGAGGYAKISGAGALTGSAAGCLLVYWPDGPPPELPGGLGGYRHLLVHLGARGLRAEELE